MKIKTLKNGDVKIHLKSGCERAIISELIAFGLDNNVEALVGCLDDLEIDEKVVIEYGEKALACIRHGRNCSHEELTQFKNDSPQVYIKLKE